MSAQQNAPAYPQMTLKHSKAYGAVLKHVQKCRACAAMESCETGAALRKAVREASAG